MSQSSPDKSDRKRGAATWRARKSRVAEPRAVNSAAGESIRSVRPLRISTTGTPPVRDACEVAVEQPLTIAIEGIGSFTVMCTPCDVEALAVGFAFSEGMITGIDDIVELACTRDPLVVAMRVDHPEKTASRRNLIVTSSCGLCGQRNIEEFLAGMVACADTLRVSGPLLVDVVRKMQAGQQLFQRTGGTHAAGVFSPAGELLALGEDVGRHNAFDKAVAKCLLQKQSPRGCGAALSGRASLELVAKAARAGIEVIAAVSAPSSLAIEVAERCNITLCGFVRDTRATVYTHPHRIIELQK